MESTIKAVIYIFGLIISFWLVIPSIAFDACMLEQKSYECSQWPKFIYGILAMLIGIGVYKVYRAVFVTIIVLLALSIVELVRFKEFDPVAYIAQIFYQGFIYVGVLVAVGFVIFNQFNENKNA